MGLAFKVVELYRNRDAGANEETFFAFNLSREAGEAKVLYL